MSKKKRNRKPPTPEQQARKTFRKANSTHIAIFELDVPHNQKSTLLQHAKSAAYIKRRVQTEMRKRIEQYHRERTYKNTIKEYHAATSETKKKQLGKQLAILQEKHGITEEQVKKISAYWANRTNIQSVFGLTIAEDVWSGVEKILYKGARKLGTKQSDDTLSLRAKQVNRGIRIGLSRRGKLAFKYENMTLYPKIGKDDLFLREEQEAITAFLCDENIERKAIQHFLKTGEITSTYRPKYVTLVFEHYRGEWHVSAHVAVEGDAIEKKKRDGSPRHHRAVDGEIGLDIGTQSYAAVGANICEMRNLAERNGKAIRDEKKLRRLQRHADRCQRAANPQYYNENGTIKKGKQEWVRSREYERTQAKIRAYHRKCALNRKYAIREDVNRLREHGSVIVSEKQSIKGWQAGLFGRSVQSRCPGAFRVELRRKFVDYVEVDIMYRASQYDHERDVYEKKKLSQRTHHHAGGRASPRDGYSGFLLWCHDSEYASPNRGLCRERFDDYYERMMMFVEDCRNKKIRIANGGF